MPLSPALFSTSPASAIPASFDPFTIPEPHRVFALTVPFVWSFLPPAVHSAFFMPFKLLLQSPPQREVFPDKACLAIQSHYPFCIFFTVISSLNFLFI